jgi:DNA-binding NarL/FixJ family response regulator
MRSIFEDILAVQDEFEENFVEIKARIKVHFPDLTKNEELVCFLLKLNYSVKEIAAQMNISAQGVEMIKYRMRKKNGFESMDKFMEHLKSI